MKQPSRKTDTACALYETGACAALNQRSCEDCPAHRDGGKNAKETAKFVEQFQSLLPDGGIAGLFESETCELCKTEPKGERDCYAIVDFGHHEPKEMRQRKIFMRSDVGFMVPLQFACCKKCRLRILLCSYLPLLLPVVFVALTLPVLLNPHAIAALRAVSGLLPALLAAVALALGFGIGKILQNVLRKKFEDVMYFNVFRHPVSLKMREKGWFPLFADKSTTPVFSKKRMDYGLGTASSEELAAYADAQAAQPEDLPEAEN